MRLEKILTGLVLAGTVFGLVYLFSIGWMHR